MLRDLTSLIYPFCRRGLDALREDAAKSSGRRRYEIAPDDVFAEDKAFADFASQAADDARRRAIGGLVEEPVATEDAPTDGNKESLDDLVAQRDFLEEQVQQQAEEISRGSRQREQMRLQEESLKARVVELQAQIEGVDGAQQTVEVGGDQQQQIDSLRQQALSTIAAVSTLLKLDVVDDSGNVETRLKMLEQALPGALSQGMEPADQMLLRQAKEAEAEIRKENSDLILRLAQHAQLVDELTAEKSTAAERLRETEALVAELEAKKDAANSEMELRLKEALEQAARRDEEMRTSQADGDAIRDLEEKVREANERAEAAEIEADKVVDEIAAMQDRVFQAERRANLAGDFDVDALELLQLERVQLKEQIKQQSEQLAAATSADNGTSQAELLEKEQTIRELQKALDEEREARSLIDEERSMRAQEAEQAEAAKDAMEQEVDKQTAELAALKNRMSELERDDSIEALAPSSAEVETLRQTVEQQREHLDVFEAESARLKQQLLEAEERLFAAQEMTRLAAESAPADDMERVRGELDEAHSRVGELEALLDTSESSRREFEEEQNSLREALEAEILQHRETADDAQSKLDSVQASLAARAHEDSQEREELRAEVKRLQAELEGTCSSMEELRTQLASSTDRELDEVASLKNELDAQRLLAEQSQVARDVLQGQVEQQSGELVALQSDLATAELKLDAAESARAEAVAAHRDIVEQQSAQASIDSGRQQETVREAEALAEEKRAALQREATALESLSAAEAKIEALQSEASAQLNPRIEADKHLVMLQEMLDDSEKETTRLASELASARLEVATLSATLGDAEAEAEARAYAAEASFATRALEADARLAASEEKMARFEASREQSIAALEAELRSASSDLDAAKREILSLTERSAAMSEELELKEASLSEHFEARNKARIAELEGELKEALAAVEKESAGLVEETSAAREALEKRCAELESEVTAMIEDADSAEVDHERELASLRAAVEAENASRLDELSRKHDRELEEFEAEHTRELKRSRDELLPALESARAENDELTRQLAKQVDLLERQLEAQAESRLEIESRISQVDLKCVAAEERAFAAEAALESQRRLVALEQTAASCVADALSSAALESFSEVAEATRGVEREDETDLAASLDAAHLLAAREREEFEEKIRIAIEERDVAIAKAEDDIRIVEARVAEVDLGAVVAEERACAAETALLESKEKVHNLEACLAATAPVEATPPFDYEQIVSAAEERASTAEAALLESREKVESLESSLSAALNATQQEDHFEIDAAEERAFTAETALEESQEELQSLETSMTEAVAKAEERTRAAEAALHESREKVRSLESSLEEVLQKQKASPREDTNGWEDHDDIFVGDDEQGGEDDEQQSSWRSRCIAAEWRASSLEDELRTAEAARGEEIESLEAALEDAEATAQAELESRLQAEHILEERKATVEELRTRLEEAEQRARALAEDRRDRRALGTMTELASAEDPGLPENVRPLEPVVEQNEAVVEVEEEVEAVEDDVVDSMHDRYREMLRTGLARDTIVDIMMRRGAVGSPAEAEAILASFDAVDDEAMFDDDELFEAVGTETDDEGELTLDAAALADEGEREVRVIELENELDQTKQELAEASDRVARLEQESTARSQQLQAELEETKQLLHDAELREQQVEEEAEAKLEESEAAWEEQRDDLVAAEDRLAASESEAAKLRARCDELERVLADRESTKPTEAVVDNDALFSAQSRAAQLDRELSDAKRKAEALEAALREAARPVDDVQSPPVPAPAPPREHGMTRQELERLAGEVAAETRLREELERRLTPNGRRAPRTPSRNGSQHTSPNRMGEDDEHWLTARAEESLRDLEDEHNDLLALLAQQELEKEVLASYVRDCVGAPTLLELKHKTQSECVEKYGVYVDYEDYNEGDNIENIIRAGEEHDLQPLTLPFDIPGETDTPENQQHLAKGQMHPPMPPPTVVATS